MAVTLYVRQDKLEDSLLETAEEALAEHGATENEQELLRRDVVHALCMDLDESMYSAAERILRQHREGANWARFWFW